MHFLAQLLNISIKSEAEGGKRVPDGWANVTAIQQVRGEWYFTQDRVTSSI